MKTLAPSLPLWLALASPTLGCATTGRSAQEIERAEAPPPVWETPQRLEAMCTDAIAAARAKREQLATAPAAREDGKTLAQWDGLLRDLDTAGGWASLMFNVHPDEAVRQTARRCQQDLSKLESEIMLDARVYAALEAVDASALDAETRRMVTLSLQDFRRAGVDRDDATRARLAAINEQLTRLMQDFRQNITDDVREMKVSRKDLAGLPDDFFDTHPAGDDGTIRITTDYPDFFPVQRYAESDAVRRKSYEQYLQRGYPTNKPILEQVLKLRAEKAKLLGHPNWASYQAEDKMVRTSETIATFLAEVVSIARPRMEADLAELLAAKKKDMPGATRIRAWDRFYYQSKVRQARYEYDEREVRQYFPYRQVKDGILTLYSELFGIRFEPLPDAPVWHPSVDALAMRDAHGAVIGVIYLDMHPRDGKYKHAAMFSPVTGTKGSTLPIGTLVCNFPAPSDKDPKALLDHSQVLTFLHEFGHLIHHQLARGSRWVRLAGINVEWDFVEAPSQLLEEWGWNAEVLRRFAKRPDTGEAIPAELVERMRAADEFGKGANVMRQLFYANFSYHLHVRPPESIDLDAFNAEMHEQFSPYPLVEGTWLYASFGHLMGYSSMYYTYQWSLAISKDLFTRFEKAGLLDAATARAYRDAILAPGGSQPAEKMVETFLGRPTNLEAYKRWLRR